MSSGNCEILHPFFKSKCILMRNHLGKTHLDSQKRLWNNERLNTTPEMLIELFKMAADRIEY